MIKEYAREQQERRRAAAEVKVVAEVPPGLSDEGGPRSNAITT